LLAAMAKTSRAPTPPAHVLAASQPARPGGRPSALRRSFVARPPMAHIAAPTSAPAHLQR
jgi:hypothetical protein